MDVNKASRRWGEESRWARSSRDLLWRMEGMKGSVGGGGGGGGGGGAKEDQPRWGIGDVVREWVAEVEGFGGGAGGREFSGG